MHPGTLMTLVYKRIIIRRKFKRKWRSTKLPADRERYVFQNSVVNNMITSAKQDYYSSKIQDNSGNTGIHFKTVQELLNSNPAQCYPSGTDNLCESFVEFFADKIVRIRNDLDAFSRIPNDSQVMLYPGPVWPVIFFLYCIVFFFCELY